MRIKKNDQVVVMTGKDRGKKGRVMRVYSSENALMVEKINYRKVAVRPTKDNPKGGIVEMEGKINIAKVKLICPRCSKPVRVGYTVLADGTKQRSCKQCNELIGG
jgi:large subunit ribosomal protein L24